MKKRTFMALVTAPLLLLGMIVGFMVFPLYGGFTLGYNFFREQIYTWLKENKK